MTTEYKITDIDITTFNKFVTDVVVTNKPITIKINDSHTTFEEREELIGDTMCKVLGLNPSEYSVGCTYEVISSDCDHTWEDEE